MSLPASLPLSCACLAIPPTKCPLANTTHASLPLTAHRLPLTAYGFYTTHHLRLTTHRPTSAHRLPHHRYPSARLNPLTALITMPSLISLGNSVASITIRKLDEQTKQRLRVRRRTASARWKTRPATFCASPSPMRQRWDTLAEAIPQRFQPLGGIELACPHGSPCVRRPNPASQPEVHHSRHQRALGIDAGDAARERRALGGPAAADEPLHDQHRASRNTPRHHAAACGKTAYRPSKPRRQHCSTRTSTACVRPFGATPPFPRAYRSRAPAGRTADLPVRRADCGHCALRRSGTRNAQRCSLCRHWGQNHQPLDRIISRTIHDSRITTHGPLLTAHRLRFTSAHRSPLTLHPLTSHVLQYSTQL